MFSTQQLDMTPRHTDAMAPLRAWTQRLLGMLSLLGLSACLVACGGGGGGAAPRFTWDATTSTLKDSTTGLYWQGVTPGPGNLTGSQRYPTVDELLLLTDKATLSDIPTQFSATLLNNDLVFATDANFSLANSVWSVSFAADSRGTVYSGDASLLPTPTSSSPQPLQPVVVTAASKPAFYRSRANANYTTSVIKGVLVTYDTENDLSWKSCSEGMALAVTTCSGTPTAYTLADLSALSFADGWRLPTKYELEGLLDRTKGPLASTKSYMLNTAYFDISLTSPQWWDASVLTFPTRIYWTSTQDLNSKKFVISFDEGSIRQDTGGSYFVRLVRNGKY